MNPRVSRSSRARVEGHRVPHREDRGAAGRGLPPGRDHERHHGGDARLVRAHPRLRRREDPAVRVREVPRGRPELTSTMKSVGEVMAIGRTFKEALGKAWRGMEKAGFDLGAGYARRRRRRRPRRRWRTAPRAGCTSSTVRSASGCTRGADRRGIEDRPVVRRSDRGGGRERGGACAAGRSRGLTARELRDAKRLGISDARSRADGGTGGRRCVDVATRWACTPVFKTVDTCGGEFPARTPYHYSHLRGGDRGRARPRGRAW